MPFLKPVVLAATLGLAALTWAAPGPAAAADKLRIGKPEAKGYDFAFLEMGVELGIFKKYNIEIESVGFAGGARMHQGMTAKAIDIALGSGADMAFVAKGAPEKGVAAMAGAPLNMALLVLPDSPFKKPADLKGKTVAVSTPGSLTAWLASEFSRRQGWTGSDSMTLVPLGTMDGEVAGLLAKNVDSIVGNTEQGHLLEQKGRVRIAVMFGDVIKDYLTHVIYASDDLMKNNPDLLRRFLKGWFESIEYMKAHKAETVRLTRPVTTLPQDIAEKIYDEQRDMYFTDGHFPEKAVDVLRQSFVDLGQLPQKPDPKVLYTEEFLPKK
jgi:ABC-type nitrate/sulfonate/bicarbonate transport system substrate-binding protein